MSSAIFEQVVEATRGEYVLHGTLGHSDALGSAFLAQEVATGRSVLLVVPPDAESLDVVGALSDTIPADAGACAACGFRVATWTDACPRCEHTLLPPPGASPDAAVLRAQLRDSLRVFGSLPHVRGGTMYFGEEVGDRRMIAFVVGTQADGQLTLDVVWEGVADVSAAAAPVRPVPLVDEPAPRTPTFDGTAWAPAGGAVGTETTADRDGPVSVVATAADPDDRGDDPGAGRARRRWLPIGVGIGVLAAVAGVAFALTRHPAPVRPTPTPPIADAPPLIDSSLTGRRTATSAPSESSGVGPSLPNNTTNVPVTVNDSMRRLRRHVRDSVRAAQAQNAAVLTIEGDLPTGWMQMVNGAAPSSARDIPLVVGTPAVIRIEAPGYCADTLSITPAPHSHQRWAPTLRGRPTVGDC